MIRRVLTTMVFGWLMHVAALGQDEPQIDKKVAEAVRVLDDVDKGADAKHRAVLDLGSLKSKAAGAIPALKKHMATLKDKNNRYYVLLTYVAIGKPALPEVIKLIDDPELGASALYEIGVHLKTEAKDAVPAVLAAINAPVRPAKADTGPGSPGHWAAAVEAIGEIGLEFEELLPLYTKILVQPPPAAGGFAQGNAPRAAYTRGLTATLRHIAHEGPRASDALPALLHLLQNLQNPKVYYEMEIHSGCITAFGALENKAESALPALRIYRASKANRLSERLFDVTFDKIKAK